MSPRKAALPFSGCCRRRTKTARASRHAVRPFLWLALALIVSAQSERLSVLALVESGRVLGPDAQKSRVSPQRAELRFRADQYTEASWQEIASSLRRFQLISSAKGSSYLIDPGRTYDLLFHGKGRPDSKAARMRGCLAAVFAGLGRGNEESLVAACMGGITVHTGKEYRSVSTEVRESQLQARRGEVHTGVCVADLNQDGFADLVDVIHTDLSRPPNKAQFVFPNDFAGVQSRVYRGNANGSFTDVTEAAGLSSNPGRARTCIVEDFNGDGLPDILLLRDDKPPALYANRGDFRFSESTWEAGDEFTSHAFFDGTATDLNHDGHLDLVLWSTLDVRVLLNKGDGRFSPAKKFPHFPVQESLFGFHGLVADLNADGWDDVLAVDIKGRIRAFLNDKGLFEETDLQMPPAIALARIQTNGSALAALDSSGSVLRLQSNRSH